MTAKGKTAKDRLTAIKQPTGKTFDEVTDGR